MEIIKPRQEKRLRLERAGRIVKRLIPRVKVSRKRFKAFVDAMWKVITFAVLLLLYTTARIVNRILKFRLLPSKIKDNLRKPLSSLYNGFTKSLDINKGNTISRIDLIELALSNMKNKKSRTLITIGGMTLGIGAIVFLVSIGYGLQGLVLSRVARLDEMKQADISPQAGGKVKIDDKTIATFKDIPNVKDVLPLVAVVGRVNYQNSISDMAVFGVTSNYLKESAIKPVKGGIFDSNDLATTMPKTGEVAGLSISLERKDAQYRDKIQEVTFLITPQEWIRVRKEPSTDSEILGYTKRVEGEYPGEEVWGLSYADNEAGHSGLDEKEKLLGKWVKASVPLWKMEKCDNSEIDCSDGNFILIRDASNQQVIKEGYLAEINLSIETANEPKVLGLSDATPEEDISKEVTSQPTEMSGDWIELEEESNLSKPAEVKKVALTDKALKKAVVNRAMLKILGITEDEAVDKKFSATFIITDDLLTEGQEKMESELTEYTIVGVIPEDRTPVFYVPLVDIRTLGISNFSQVKIIAKDEGSLGKIRDQIRALGYQTASVADTVKQVKNLFSTVRTILLIIGLVALAVASLGMFNTLTISLLERTREVGLMKAMGMKSTEVQELFLTESMIMGFYGGLAGIIAGFLAGKLLGIILSLFALFKGVGFIDVSLIPIPFVLVIIILSLFVGIGTGVFPAKRATKISALDALRYE